MCFLAGKGGKPIIFGFEEGAPRPSFGASRRVYPEGPGLASVLGARHVACDLSALGCSLRWGRAVTRRGKSQLASPLAWGSPLLLRGKSRSIRPGCDPPRDFSLRVVSRIGKAWGFEPRRSGQFLLPGLVEIGVLEASFHCLSFLLN